MQRAGGRHIVAVGNGSAPVGGGEVHVECGRAAAACGREGRHLRAAVALADRDVVDRDRARNWRRSFHRPGGLDKSARNEYAILDRCVAHIFPMSDVYWRINFLKE